MGDTFAVNAFKSAYAETWNGFANGEAFKGVALFIVGAIVFYALFEKSRKGFSPREIWNYVFPQHLYGHASTRADKWNFLLTMFVWWPLSSAIATIVGALAGTNVNEMLTSMFGAHAPLFHQTWLIVTVQVSILYLTWQFTEYVVHVAWHRIPILWSIHRAHHSAEALTFFAATRAHPLEWVGDKLEEVGHLSFFGGLMLYLTGTAMHPSTIATYLVVLTINGLGNVLAHAHIPVSFGKINYVIGSSVLHQIHHSAELRHRDKNFGLNFMVFDWLFGTLYLPKPAEAYRWGINEEEIGEHNPHVRIRDLYLEPFRNMWKVVAGKFG